MRYGDRPDEVEYLPRFQQQLDARAKPPFSRTLFKGGVGAGKTMTAGDFILEEMCNYPNGFMIVAGATMPAMEKATILKVMGEIRARNVWVDYTDYKKECKFSNGSWFKFQSLDVPTKELEGSEINALMIDEITACPKAQVYSLLNRVRLQSPCATEWAKAQAFNLPTAKLVKPGDPEWWDYSRRVLFCGNPPEAGHWLEKAFVPPEGSEDVPLGEIVTMTSYDNKLLSKDYLDNLERQHRPGTAAHRRMMLGEFGVAPEGACYSEYLPSKHIVGIDEVPLDEAYAWMGGIDLGHGDPFVYLGAVLCKNGVVYFISEYYSTTPKVMIQHAGAIRSRYRGGPIFCDWDGQQRLELKALGVKTIPANKDLAMGIHAVRSRLANGTIKFVRGACPNLLRELPHYVWGPEDKPLKSKEGDHALDAMRYIVAGLDLPRDKK